MHVFFAVLFLACLANVCLADWQNRVPVQPKTWILDLDVDAEHRWDHIASNYIEETAKVIDYLHGYLPKWAIPVVEAIGADLANYPGFAAYADEMRGLARVLKMKLGDVVMANMVYQLEELGSNCSAWNTTGPGCTSNSSFTGLSMCTSVVAQDPQGKIWHGRNLDWNLPNALRQVFIDVVYTRNNKTLFTGTQLVGYVGLINGAKLDPVSGFSVSMNARGRGGKILDNFVEMLKDGAVPPGQHMRTVLEKADSFASAVDGLASGDLIDEIYYIVGGVAPGEGVVVTRDRNDAANLWWLNPAEENGWFRLQTNYDHWKPVPAADNRRDPGNKHMIALGQAGVNQNSLLKIMKTWPTYNMHTDFTGVLSAYHNYYYGVYWSGN